MKVLGIKRNLEKNKNSSSKDFIDDLGTLDKLEEFCS